jgi:hypothetical protein
LVFLFAVVVEFFGLLRNIVGVVEILLGLQQLDNACLVVCEMQFQSVTQVVMGHEDGPAGMFNFDELITTICVLLAHWGLGILYVQKTTSCGKHGKTVLGNPG